jgi:fibronectin-binding autotransporter adhesin
MTVTGNFTNNGTVDFTNGGQYATPGNGAITLTFIGATDNTLACNGVTDLYNLFLNKGLASTNILSVTSASPGNLNFHSAGILLNLSAGTLRLGSNISMNRINNGGNYDLGLVGVKPDALDRWRYGYGHRFAAGSLW